MFGTHDLLLFIFAGWLLNITPGPDTALIVARSTQLGLKGGAMACAGVAAGIMVHVTAAALGISALIAASATAFGIVKFLGAAYLIYIGIKMIVTRRANDGETPAALRLPLSYRKVFRQGFVTNALNPKVALFFLAFLPQFIDNNAPSTALAFLFLGVVFNVNGTIWNLGVAWATARAAATMRGAKYFQRWIDCTIGALFIAFGVRLALFQR
ncbi:MAG: LysE family translocator [Pseudolabrys sp.]|nr:LysE family translocator [Pseudolabrys sp.]